MKKLLALMLAAALLFAFVSAGLAAAGDAVLLRGGSDGFSGNIRNLAYADDTLYVLADGALYTFEGEQTTPARYELEPAPAEEGTEKDAMRSVDVQAVVAHEGRPCAVAIQSMTEPYAEDGETFYSVSLENAGLFAIEFDAQSARLGEEIALFDWEDVLQTGESDCVFECFFPFVSGGCFYKSSYDSSGRNFLMATDLGDGSCTAFYYMDLPGGDGIARFFPYREGELLYMANVWTNAGSVIRFYRFAPESGAVEELCELPGGDNSVDGPVYDGAADAIYYVQNGELCMMTGFDPDTIRPVAEFPLNSVHSTPVITSGGLYAAADYDTLVRRNTDPAQRAPKRLTVYDTYSDAVESAYYAFANRYGDVEVVVTAQAGDILQAMLTRSAAVDVYCLGASSEEYDALYRRGFLPALSDVESAAELVENCYPFVREACMKDGEVVAVPTQLHLNAALYYDLAAFERLGLTAEDVPATWPELFDALQPLAERAMAAGMALFETYESRDYLPQMLFSGMFQEYSAYVAQPGNELTYDTPAFRTALDAYEAVNWDALGLLSVDEIDGLRDGEILFGGDAEHNVLFGTSGSIGAETWVASEAYQWLPLGFSRDIGPQIVAEMTVAFVNPYSENPAEARAFVETLAARTDGVLRLELSAQSDEPVPCASFESELAAYEQMIADVGAALETAKGEEKALYEERLAAFEQEREDYLREDGWEASAESVSLYRERAQYIALSRNIGLSGAGGEEILTLLNRYANGMIAQDALISGLDSRLQMMQRENA